MSIVIGFDAIRTNIQFLPKNAAIVAGYSTGTGDVPWTAADFAAHPGSLRIDQDPSASDPTADYLDVENGAATLADCAPWAKRAWASWHAAIRPGQRKPAIYCSASNVTPVANSLIAGGVTSGVGLVIANWNLTEGQAATDLLAAIILLASGAADPFPIVGIQFADPGPYDIDVYSAAWLADVSVLPAPPPPRVITDGILQSHTMHWSGRRMKSADHGKTWTAVNP